MKIIPLNPTSAKVVTEKGEFTVSLIGNAPLQVATVDDAFYLNYGVKAGPMLRDVMAEIQKQAA